MPSGKPATPQIKCPECGAEFELTAALAAPLLEQAESSAARKIADANKRAAAAETAQKQAELNIEARISESVAKQRKDWEKEMRSQAEADAKVKLDSLQERNQDLQSKLAASKAAELDALKLKQAAEEVAENAELEIAKRVDEERKKIKASADESAQEAQRLKLLEKDKVIADMREKLAEAERKATQGSQQLQGEVLELDLFERLKAAFPSDEFEEVAKGQRGGDIIHRVNARIGSTAGIILWESKRTKSWGSDWCAKAKKDAASAKAEIAIIVSDILPDGVEDCGPYDGIWVTRQSHAILLITALRHGIMNVAETRLATTGRETKAERLYTYMTGPEFRAIIEGIALPFLELSKALEAEKRTTQVRWNKQEKLLARVLSGVAGLQGDLQGIAGSEMPELPGFATNDEAKMPEEEK